MPTDKKKKDSTKAAKGAKDAKDVKKKKSVDAGSAVSENAPPPPAVAATAPVSGGSNDFEAGQLFERYSGTGSGVLEKSQFQKLLADLKGRSVGGAAPPGQGALSDEFTIGRAFERYADPSTGVVGRDSFANFLKDVKNGEYNTLTPRTGFEAGRLFARYDPGNKGMLDRSQFERMIYEVSRGNNIQSIHPESILHDAINKKEGALMCPLHAGQVVKYYCETTASGACEVCRSSGIHGGQAHRCFPLEEAYRYHLGRLQNVYHAPLLAKREQLTIQICHIQERIEELASVRRAIERETLADSEGILQRLRSAEAFKLSLLQYDLEELYKDTKSIEHFEESIRSSRTSTLFYNSRIAPDTLSMSHSHSGGGAGGLGGGVSNANGVPSAKEMLEVLQRYPELQSEADRLVAKPFKNIIEVNAELDRETKSRLDLLDHAESNLASASIKEQMMLQLVEQRDALLARQTETENEMEDLGKASSEEMAEWQALTEKLAGELELSHKKCDTLESNNRALLLEMEELRQRLKVVNPDKS